MLNFKECTLNQLDETFGLTQRLDSSTLKTWLDGVADISQNLLNFQRKLRLNVHDWNETELAYNFIGPLMAMVDFTTAKFNFFAERQFGGQVKGTDLMGRPDGMVASGFRQPKKPFFCLQEYKRHKDPDGDPAAQALAAMLVAQEINEYKHPIYGGHIIGRDWYFMILQ